MTPCSIVELNVGGRYFSTTKETLLQYGSPYFERLLSDFGNDDLDGTDSNNRNGHDFPAPIRVRGANRDRDGRLYIDKDPDLFKHILDYLRDTFDPDDLSDKERKLLRKEALYYGLGTLHELLRPASTGYDEHFLSEEDQPIRKQAQFIREQLKNNVAGAATEADNMLIDVFSPYNENEIVLEDVFETPLSSPDASILFESRVEQARRSLTVNVPATADEFKQRMIEFGGPLLKNFPFHKNLIVAGGSVLQMLLQKPDDAKSSDCDLDLFLVASTPEDGIEAYNAILEHFTSIENRQGRNVDQRRDIEHNQLFVTRSSYAVTFCLGEPQRHIQVILIQYPCIASVLFNFDVDCSQVAWDGNSNKVWATPSAVRAIKTGVNIADPERCTSTEYEVRLAKFAQRGFMIAVPGLDTLRIPDYLLNDTCYSYFDFELRRLHITFTTGERVPKVVFDKYPPIRGLAKLIVASSFAGLQGNYFILYKDWDSFKGSWEYLPPMCPPVDLLRYEIVTLGERDSTGNTIMPWRGVRPIDIFYSVSRNEGSVQKFCDGIRRRTRVYDYIVDISVQRDTPNVRDGKNQFLEYPFANENLYTAVSSLSRHLRFQPSTGDHTPWRPYNQEEWTRGVYESA